jgi:nitroreductase
MSRVAVLSDHQRVLLSAAGAAPSVLNTQPWLFRFVDKTVQVHRDDARRLPALDPSGRQLVISCGAALHNLRTAARHLGYEPVVSALPEPDQPGLLASVDLRRRRPPSAAEERRYAAIERRHTARTRYTDERLPAEVVAHLEELASAQGAVLRVLPRRELATLLELAARADAALRRRPEVRDELARWVGVDPATQHEGIPAEALGLVDTGSRPAVRDFAPGRDIPGRPVGPSEAEPNLMLLSTFADQQVNWLRAGMALQSVLLEVTAAGLVASFLTQALEDEQVRSWARDCGHPLTHPQMILRVGHGKAGPPTPRRPLTDLVLA